MNLEWQHCPPTIYVVYYQCNNLFIFFLWLLHFQIIFRLWIRWFEEKQNGRSKTAINLIKISLEIWNWKNLKLFCNWNLSCNFNCNLILMLIVFILLIYLHNKFITFVLTSVSSMIVIMLALLNNPFLYLYNFKME